MSRFIYLPNNSTEFIKRLLRKRTPCDRLFLSRYENSLQKILFCSASTLLPEALNCGSSDSFQKQSIKCNFYRWHIPKVILQCSESTCVTDIERTKPLYYVTCKTEGYLRQEHTEEEPHTSVRSAPLRPLVFNKRLLRCTQPITKKYIPDAQ